jgi:hypothetical protein
MSCDQSSCCPILPDIRTALIYCKVPSLPPSCPSDQSRLKMEYRTLVERYWQGEPDKTKNPVTVPLCTLEISREMAMHRILAFAYRQRWSWHGLHVCLRWSRLQRRRTSEKTQCSHKGRSCCVCHRQRYCSNICTNRLVTFNYTRSKHLMKIEKNFERCFGRSKLLTVKERRWETEGGRITLHWTMKETEQVQSKHNSRFSFVLTELIMSVWVPKNTKGVNCVKPVLDKFHSRPRKVIYLRNT